MIAVAEDELRLPRPGSSELAQLHLGSEEEIAYAYVFERRDNPPTMVEITNHVHGVLGRHHAHTGRRVRSLRKHFELPAVRSQDGEFRYPLLGLQTVPRDLNADKISSSLRGEVLSLKRCAMCGKTPLEDDVKLVVDHILPQAWGGTGSRGNLQPLCEECNHGKQDYYSTFETYADEIRQAATENQPHKRIGNLLLAFGEEWVPSELIGVVANCVQLQDDWNKRMRELRILGWDYEYTKRRERGAVRTKYRLTASKPWPPGSVSAEVRRIETARRKLADEPEGSP